MGGDAPLPGEVVGASARDGDHASDSRVAGGDGEESLGDGRRIRRNEQPAVTDDFGEELVAAATTGTRAAIASSAGSPNPS